MHVDVGPTDFECARAVGIHDSVTHAGPDQHGSRGSTALLARVDVVLRSVLQCGYAPDATAHHR